MNKCQPVALGVAIGVLWAAYVFLAGIVAMFGWGTALVETLVALSRLWRIHHRRDHRRDMGFRRWPHRRRRHRLDIQHGRERLTLPTSQVARQKHRDGSADIRLMDGWVASGYVSPCERRRPLT